MAVENFTQLLSDELASARARILELESQLQSLQNHAQNSFALVPCQVRDSNVANEIKGNSTGTNPRLSEERYRTLAEALPQIVFVTDAQGQCKLVTRHWEEQTGAPADECLGLNWLKWVHPDDVNGHLARWQECVAKGLPFEAEYRLRNAEGEYRWHLARAVPIRDGDGAIQEWVGSSTNIHNRKTTEENLRSSEELFRLASQAVEGFVYDWDPRSGVVHRSGNLASVAGVAPEEAEPNEEWWQQRVHPADVNAASLNVIAAMDKTQHHYETEFRFQHTDGHWVHLCDRGFVIRDEHGTPIRIVGSSHDVSERRRLEHEIAENLKQLKFQAQILETTEEIVVALDANLCIRYCNTAAERLYGARLADVIGQPLPALHGYAWLAPGDEELCLRMLAERGSWNGEYVHILKDGSQIVVHSAVNVLPPAAGGGMVAVIRNITQRKQAEVQAKEQTAYLARANEDLLHFAYAVSHDLQAPLRTVTSFSQLLALKYKQRLDGQGAEFVRWIVDASTRMDTMLRDLLQFAKVAGGDAAASESVSLEDAFWTAVDSLRSVVEETQAIITHDPLPAVAGDEGQLIQLFQNLLGNSLKYRNPGVAPRIHVSGEDFAKEFVVHIRDNGLGFESKYAERIFGVFQRLHGKDFAGTGIGLTICKRIVERRGGRIWAEAQPGEGATFSFSIPHSTATVPVEPSMDWTRLHTVLENRPFAADGQVAAGHFDELFKTLDLAQATVRSLDGEILIWTKGAERLFGWTAAEAQGKQLHELIGTQFPESQAAVEGALLRNGEWTGELRAQKKDGGVVWLACHKALYRDGSGRPQSVIEVHNDITALKETEAALTRSSEQRDLARQAGHMGILRWDKRTGVLEWSPAIEGFLGMDPGSFEGTFEAVVKNTHPDDLRLLQQWVDEAFQNGLDYAIDLVLRRNHFG